MYNIHPDMGPRTNSWFVTQYEITNQEGIDYIVATNGKPTEFYNPYDFQIPHKRTGLTKDVWLHSAPHIALLRMDLNDRKQILDFVNQWGLLGLWLEGDVKYIAAQAEFNGVVTGYIEGEQYSLDGDGLFMVHRVFVNPSHVLERGNAWVIKHISDWQIFREPVWLFTRVVKEFQSILPILDENQWKSLSYEAKSSIIWRINQYTKHCQPHLIYEQEENDFIGTWGATNLLRACYLFVLQNFMSRVKYRICENGLCQRPFPVEREGQKYCIPEVCGNNKRRRDAYYRKKEGLPPGKRGRPSKKDLK